MSAKNIKRYLLRHYDITEAFGNSEVIKMLDAMEGRKTSDKELESKNVIIKESLTVDWKCPSCDQIQYTVLHDTDTTNMPPVIYKKCVNCNRVIAIPLDISTVGSDKILCETELGTT